MASAWGNSWGLSWANSWGTGATPEPEVVLRGGSGIRKRLRARKKLAREYAESGNEFRNQIASNRQEISPSKSYGEVTYELDLNGVSQSEVDAEIAYLLHKKQRTQDEEIFLLLIMVAVAV